MLEKKRIQVQRRLIQIMQPNDKLIDKITNLAPDKYAEDMKKRGSYQSGVIERKKNPQVATKYTLRLKDDFKDFTALNQFDKAVLIVCISERAQENYNVTVDRIFRGLTGGKVHNSTRMTEAMKKRILQSVTRMMSVIIEIDATDTAAHMKYPDLPKNLVAPILPATYDTYVINGQEVTTIHLFEESPLAVFARAKNYQILNYDARLLDVAGLHNTERVIALKFYVVERVMEIVLHNMTATITFEDVFAHCGLDGATRKQKFDARKSIVAVMERLKEEEIIKNFTLEKNGEEFRAIKIEYTKHDKHTEIVTANHK